MSITPAGARDLVYRTLPGGPTIGCGFIAKPDPTGVQVEFRDPRSFAAVVLLEGAGEYWDRTAGRVPLAAGDLVLRLPGVHHRTVPADDGRWREFFLLLPASGHGTLHELGAVDDRRAVWRPGLDGNLLGPLLAFLPALRAAHDGDLARHSLAMLAWIARACRSAADAGEDPRLATARLRLGADLDRSLDLIRLARELGMSYTHFRRWFRQSTGQPPAAWRLARRLDRARALLAGTPLPLADIARQAGFCDRYAFSRAFAAAAGCPPGEFRRRHG